MNLVVQGKSNRAWFGVGEWGGISDQEVSFVLGNRLELVDMKILQIFKQDLKRQIQELYLSFFSFLTTLYCL